MPARGPVSDKVATLHQKEARARRYKILGQTHRSFPRALPVRPPFHVRRIFQEIRCNALTLQRDLILQCFVRFLYQFRSRRNRSQSRADDTCERSGTLRYRALQDASRARPSQWLRRARDRIRHRSSLSLRERFVLQLPAARDFADPARLRVPLRRFRRA